MRRVWFLVWKELIELGQDPRLFGVVVIAPILQLVMLGYAATTDVRNVPVVVADGDRSAASRDLIERFRVESLPSEEIVLLGLCGSTCDNPRPGRGLRRVWLHAEGSAG